MDELLSPQVSEHDTWVTQMEREELSKQSFLIDVVVECADKSSPPKASASATELWVHQPGEIGLAQCFALTEIVSGRWEVWGLIELPFGKEAVECVLKTDEGVVVGSTSLDWPVSGWRYLSVAAAEGGVEPMYFLRVNEIQQSVAVDETELHLQVSGRVVHILLSGGATHEMADHLARSSLSIVQQHLSDGKSEESVADTAEVLGLRMAVHLIDQSGDLVESVLSSLTRLELQRFKRTSDLGDLSRSISDARRLVSMLPEHSTKLPTLLDSLVDAYDSRWKRLKNLADIDSAISLGQRAIDITPPSAARLLGRLARVGNTFGMRFLETNDVSDISGAISTWESALERFPQDRRLQAKLGEVYRKRYNVAKNPSDLDQALSFASLAVDGSAEVDSNLWGLLFFIGHEFNDRSQLTNSVDDIDKSIAAFRRAAQLIPPDSEHFMDVISRFAKGLKARFYRTRDASDIAEAIATVQKAIDACSEGHPSLASFFELLGSTFEARFDHDGDPSDISASVALNRKAIALTPADDPRFPSIACALGSSLHTRFHSTSDVKDADEAIAWYRRASELCGNNDRRHLIRLSGALVSRFNAGGDVSLIEEAMSVIQKAADAPQGQDGDTTAEPMLLSAMLFSRFSRNRDDSDISGAISLAQGALQMTQEDQGGRQTRLHDYACVSSPEERFDSARSWGSLSSVHYPNSPDTLEAFDTALDLVVLVDSLGQATRGYFTRLQGASDLPPEAAAAACTASRIDKAVEWLEKGRCLVWSRLSHLRAPFERLRECDEELADAIADVAQQLQSSGHRQSSSMVEIPLTDETSVRYRALTHARLTKQWDDLVGKVRLLPSFEAFLKPLECSEILQGLPEEGPIVVINVHKGRCDGIALIDGLGEPLHIPLPQFSWEKARRYSCELKVELQERGLRGRGEDEATEAGDPERKMGSFAKKGVRKEVRDERPVVRDILRCLWTELVKPILDMLGISKGDPSSRKPLPRIWWCPTGPLSFLPIHAAGIYNAVDGECLLDYAVSSYTPTVTMLAQRVHDYLPIEKAASGLFLTSQPAAPRTKKIPGTTGEVRSIFTKATALSVRVGKADGNDVTPDQCLEHMKEFSSVHLACHAIQHPDDPLKSKFKFHLGDLELAAIMQADLRHADFAFLSACQTSAGHDTLSEEAIHLAAGMLTAGYRRVVATMWSIRDDVAPRVAGDFYDFIWSRGDRACGESGFDGRMSAYALHHALQQARARLPDSEGNLLAWIPYVHFGY